MKALFAAGCFWGVEEAFRKATGVVATTVGYTGGKTKNPTYEDVCGDATGHAEAVLVEFDEKKTPFEKLLGVFWGCHDPTQWHRQGPDVGSQYRSAIFFFSKAQEKEAIKSLGKEQEKLGKKIVTEITAASTFYPAEEYHQKYLQKHGKALCHF